MSALVYNPNAFNAEAVGLILAPLWEQLPRDAPERTALQATTLAMLYPFIPPDSFYGENGCIIASMEALIADTQRGHAFVAYFEPWVQGILSTGSPSQRDFIIRCGLTEHAAPQKEAAGLAEVDDTISEDDPTETEPHTPIVYPRPARAIDILQGLAQKYESISVQHTAIEMAILSLKYIIDSGQEEPFVVFLEEGQKPCPPEKLARFGVSVAEPVDQAELGVGGSEGTLP